MSAAAHCPPAAEPSFCGRRKLSGSLPTDVDRAVWLAADLGQRHGETCATGWRALDEALPGGGWPRQSVTEVLAAQPSVLEWRLLAGALRPIVESHGQVVVVGPPQHPHLPGLHQAGLDERHLIWIRAESPAERLWVTEQLVKATAASAIVAWLPQARQEQIRRLQVGALACDGLVFLCRPESARHEASAAPLRVHAKVGIDWELTVDIVKRRGPSLDRPLVLPSVPAGLKDILTPRLRKPSSLARPRELPDVVGSPVVAPRPGQPATA